MRTILKRKRFSFVFDLYQLKRKKLDFSLQLPPVSRQGSAGNVGSAVSAKPKKRSRNAVARETR